MPGRSVTQVNVLDDAGRNPKLTAYSTKLEKMWSIDLPGTDNPEATRDNEAEVVGFSGSCWPASRRTRSPAGTMGA